jgi:hypothetical protein
MAKHKANKPPKRDGPHHILDAYDAQIAAAEAAGDEILRLELTSGALDQLNDAYDAKKGTDDYRGIPVEIVETQVIPEFVGMSETHLRNRYPVAIRGIVSG